uniref:Prefoldin subunit 2 n=1 Tax=Brassica oleracea var. oleracea TaxID=109376 RepID=A0A0D3CH60_BRAOL
MASGDGGLREPPNEQAVLNIYEAMRSELSQIYSNITDLEMQVSEHSLVINAIQPLDQSRKCFRMIGGVLVERTVRNKEGLEEVVRKLYETLEKKKKDMTEFEAKNQIRLRKQDDSNKEEGDKKKEGNAQGVLVGAAATSSQ